MRFLHEHIKVMSAHVKALYELRAIKKSELYRALSILRNLEKKRASGRLREKAPNSFQLIKNHISKKSKNLAEKVLVATNPKDHTATSKRLYIKDKSKEIQKATMRLATTFLYLAENNRNFAISSNSTLAHWALSFTEGLYDDIQVLKSITLHQNKSPLGALDGYGTELLLPRELQRKELKLKTTQINSLYCITSQEKFERLFIESLIQIIIDLNRFAIDTIGFMSPKSKLFKIKKSLRDLTELKKIPKNSKVILKSKNITTCITLTLQSLETAQLYIKSLKPNLPAKTPDPLSNKISLGAPGNLDINYYKTLLRKF